MNSCCPHDAPRSDCLPELNPEIYPHLVRHGRVRHPLVPEEAQTDLEYRKLRTAAFTCLHGGYTGPAACESRVLKASCGFHALYDGDRRLGRLITDTVLLENGGMVAAVGTTVTAPRQVPRHGRPAEGTTREKVVKYVDWVLVGFGKSHSELQSLCEALGTGAGRWGTVPMGMSTLQAPVIHWN